MKQVAVAAIALVLGLILGGLGPRADVRKLEARIQELEAQPRGGGTLGRDLAALMGGRGNAPAPDRNPLGDRPAEVIAAENPEAAEVAAQLNEDSAHAEASMKEDLQNVDPEQLKLARAAIELRRAQARAALVEAARPGDKQMEDVDTAVRTMNTTLLSLADELSGMITDGQEPSRHDAMEFAADALDAMIVAEDAMRAALDSDQLADLPEGALDPFSYVSPELVDVLTQLGATAE